jgi:hypothetical protein
LNDSARSLAWKVLTRIDHEGAYANLSLRAELDRSALDERDRSFVTELVYGTTRMRRACDALVDPFLLREPEPAIREPLRAPWRPFPARGDGRAWALFPHDADTDGMVVLRYRQRA